MQVVFDTILSGDFSTAQIGVCLCIESSGLAIDVFAFYSPFMVFFAYNVNVWFTHAVALLVEKRLGTFSQVELIRIENGSLCAEHQFLLLLRQSVANAVPIWSPEISFSQRLRRRCENTLQMHKKKTTMKVVVFFMVRGASARSHKRT